MITALLRAEYRKTASTRLWWALAIPVGVVALLIGLFGGAFAIALGPVAGDDVPVVLGALAYALGLTAVFAAVHGAITTAGEFRHRTITTTYLTAPGRGVVLAVKMLAAAAVGALYALLTTVCAVLGTLLGQGAVTRVGTLVTVVAVGVAVCALWGALAAALGTVLTNQATVLVLVLVYVLLAELLVSALLALSESAPVAGISAFLPVNAGESALYDVPARALAGPDVAPTLVAATAGVSGPLPSWGALLVLLGWTLAAAAVAWWAGARRDVT